VSGRGLNNRYIYIYIYIYGATNKSNPSEPAKGELPCNCFSFTRFEIINLIISKGQKFKTTETTNLTKGQSYKIQTRISQERPNKKRGKKSKFYTNSVKTKQPIQSKFHHGGQANTKQSNPIEHNNFSIQPNKSRKSTLDAS
jgi:hypothetical protein